MNKKFPTEKQIQDSAAGSQKASNGTSHGNTLDFIPSSDEVARRAFFCYENEGSKPGRDVQHWLAAEAELTAERNRTRVHAFHNRT